MSRKVSSSAPSASYTRAISTGSPASRRPVKFTPLTTRPASTSRQGITRTARLTRQAYPSRLATPWSLPGAALAAGWGDGTGGLPDPAPAGGVGAGLGRGGTGGDAAAGLVPGGRLLVEEGRHRGGDARREITRALPLGGPERIAVPDG